MLMRLRGIGITPDFREVFGNLRFARIVLWRWIHGAEGQAIIAAIALTLRGRKDSKSQDPSRQVRVRREDRVRLVAMANENEARQTKKA